MAKVRLAQTSFINGEFSPLLVGRSDLDRGAAYRHGAAVFKNMAPLAQGGGRTRPGLVFRAILQPGARTEPFVFNDDQRYILAFADARLDVYLPDGTLATSLTGCPWTSAMVARLAYAHYGDTMILCHPDMPMQVLKRTGASSFSLAAFDFEQATAGQPKYQPYYKFADSAITLTPSAVSGAITMVLSGAGAFVAGHVGAIIRYKKKEILVTAVTDANNASGTVRETLPGTTADADWDEPVFSAARGYAVSAEFHSNRLAFGGAKSRPTGIWLSKIGAYYNFDLGTQLDNEAIWDAVASGRIAEVRHLLSARHLLVFTDQGLFYVPESSATPLTPKNFGVKSQTPYGSAWIRPVDFDGAALFVQKSGAVVREAVWLDTEQAYASNAVSLLAEHLVADPVALSVLYGSPGRPEQYALLVNGDGRLSVFHSIRDKEVLSWQPWETQGTVKGIAAVGQEVFLAVERTLNAGTTLCLEQFNDDAAPLDCALKATSGAATKTFTGFTHLVNQTVRVVSKGHYLGTYQVAPDGSITLGELAPEVTEIEAGFWTECRIRPMPVDFDMADGPARGLMKRLVRALLLVDRSAAFQVAGTDVLLTFQGDDFANEPQPATGQLEIRLLGVGREGQFDTVVADPAKVTVLGLTREVQVAR